MYAKAQETMKDSVSYLGYTLSKLPHVLTWKEKTSKNYELTDRWENFSAALKLNS